LGGGRVSKNAGGADPPRASVPVVHVTQALQPVTDLTRQVTAEAGVPHTIPGLRQAVVALRNVAWWSEATCRLG
jgi:acetate---CoA ligase (ADP-forming)